MTTDNARQRFKNAVGILVDEQGGVKQRLKVAFISQLLRVDPQQELPSHLAEMFGGIKFKLTTDEVDGDRGTVSKELAKISDEEASHIARQIFDILLELFDLKEEADHGSHVHTA